MSDPLSSVSGADMTSSVSMAVARKALDAAKFEGAAAVSLIRAAGTVGKQNSQQVDSALPGKPGSQLDVVG